MQGYLERHDSAQLAALSRATQVLIWIYIAAWSLYALVSGWRLGLILTAQPFGQIWTIALALQGIVTAVGMLVFLPCAVLFLMWFHKALSNLRLAALSGLIARPGWSIGSFFVPGANLFVPFGAMRELWNRSHGEDEWQAKASVSEVVIWWTCLWAGTLLAVCVNFVGLINILTNLKIVTPPGVNIALDIGGVALSIISAVFLLRIVNRITEAQSYLSNERLVFA